MCCFSGPVQSVSGTHIFARDAGNGRQFLVYEMNYQASQPLAMVLPLPVPPGRRADAVEFIDLSNYKGFFYDMREGFVDPQTRFKDDLEMPLSASSLPIIQVGSFEASFVPTPRDFARLDPRFRMPSEVWRALPAYRHFGFAVFKLREKYTAVHPMAISFVSAAPGTLFFPTVHVHDGQVHKTAMFDHNLYCQVGTNHLKVAGWQESPKPAVSFMTVGQTWGIVDGESHCYMKRMDGRLANRDTIL